MDIWDKLYEAKLALENNHAVVDCVVLHPFSQLAICYRYRRLGYPLGKTVKGLKKFSKKFKSSNINYAVLCPQGAPIYQDEI